MCRPGTWVTDVRGQGDHRMRHAEVHKGGPEMPWQECSVMSERQEFVAFARQEGANSSVVCGSVRDQPQHRLQVAGAGCGGPALERSLAPTTVPTRLTAAFGHYGLPHAMLCDNGAPWGTAGMGGLTRCHRSPPTRTLSCAPSPSMARSVGGDATSSVAAWWAHRSPCALRMIPPSGPSSILIVRSPASTWTTRTRCNLCLRTLVTYLSGLHTSTAL